MTILYSSSSHFLLKNNKIKQHCIWVVEGLRRWAFIPEFLFLFDDDDGYGPCLSYTHIGRGWVCVTQGRKGKGVLKLRSNELSKKASYRYEGGHGMIPLLLRRENLPNRRRRETSRGRVATSVQATVFPSSSSSSCQSSSRAPTAINAWECDGSDYTTRRQKILASKGLAI